MVRAATVGLGRLPVSSGPATSRCVRGPLNRRKGWGDFKPGKPASTCTVLSPLVRMETSEPVVLAKESGDASHERGLSRAVGTEQRGPLPRSEIKIDPIERLESAERPML